MNVDFSDAYDPTATIDWREEAARLAFARGLHGRARLARTSEGHARHTPVGQIVYYCISANEPRDHTVLYSAKTAGILCDCEAAMHQRPCAHAGAVLLLRARLAREDAREEAPHA